MYRPDFTDFLLNSFVKRNFGRSFNTKIYIYILLKSWAASHSHHKLTHAMIQKCVHQMDSLQPRICYMRTNNYKYNCKINERAYNVMSKIR